MTEQVTDFETASAVELKKVGAWAYAEHPTTEVLCLSFEADGRIVTWHPIARPWKGPHTSDLMRLIEDHDVIFVSHGDFERAIWHCIMVPLYGFPPLPPERWTDTMAVCAMKQLPLKLEEALVVLHSPFEKDAEGSKLTISLSKVNKKSGMLDRSPATLRRVYQYCESDVAGERWLLNRVGGFQPGEREVWLLDQKINQRGVGIDLDYVRACQKVVDGAMVPLDKEFSELTGGLRITQRDRIMEWLRARTDAVPDLKKATIEGLIGKGVDVDDEDEDESDEGDDGSTGGDISGFRPGAMGLHPQVKRVLGIRQLAGSASIKKLGAMLACTSSDGRARGLLQYHRAGPGRWAGRLLQPQNFPRPSLKDEDGDPVSQDAIVAALMTGDWTLVEAVVGPAIQAVVSGLRHAIRAGRGNALMSGDYAQIEARIVLALAGQYDKVDVFEKYGSAIYADMACDIFGLPKPDFSNKKALKDWKETHLFEYTIGKNTVLGAGFGMGGKTFFERYCPMQSLEFGIRVVKTYRKDFAPKVPKLWYGTQAAAVDTVWSGTPHSYAGTEYSLEDGWLVARIPSGRKLYYWNPKKVKVLAPWTDDEGQPVYKASFTYEAKKMGVWRTIYIHGGLLVENIVQALARDILVHAMLKLEANGYPTVLTVHDEDVVEVPEFLVDEKGFAEVLSERPEWAVEMKVPIAVETWVGERYRK